MNHLTATLASTTVTRVSPGLGQCREYCRKLSILGTQPVAEFFGFAPEFALPIESRFGQ
jgi:hypothetical protein